MIRQRLSRLTNAALNLLGELPVGSSVVRSIDQAAARARHRVLEEQLDAANAEIDRLEVVIGELSKQPSAVEKRRQVDALEHELETRRRMRGNTWG